MPAPELAVGVLLALSSVTSAFVSIPVVRNGGDPGIVPYLVRRGAWEQTMANNITGGGYYAQVAVGTPPQDVTLIVDTGSSDVWILDENADLCRNRTKQAESGVGGCIQTYDNSESSSYELVDRGGFSIQYLSGEGSRGDYIKEDFHIGGTTIEGLQMGLAKFTDINSGLIGVGFGNSVAAESAYPNIMDEFKSQGLIETMGYSLWLNDLSSDSGSILFGAIDTKKFIGSIDRIALVPAVDDNYYHFQVVMTGLAITSPSEAFDDVVIDDGQLPVILDSGTTLSYLPSDIVGKLFDTLDAFDDTAETGLVFVSCSVLEIFPDMEFSFTFGDPATKDLKAAQISVPVREMVLDNVRVFLRQGYTLPPYVPFEDDDACTLGLQAIDGGGAASRGGTTLTNIGLLGDTFLRSAYVVYDLDNKEIGLAQANLNSSESNIVEMTNGIPEGVTGVESQIPYTATAGLSFVTDSTGGVATVTITSSSNDENAAPQLRVSGLLQEGVVGAMVMLWMALGGLMVVL